MKQAQTLKVVGEKTTFVQVWKWGEELKRLHARIAPHFARPEPHRRALAFMKGIVSDVSRKNGGPLAEHAGEARPDGMQRLLNQAVWDADLVRDEMLTYVLEQLGDLQAVLVIDETSFRKRGKKSAGVSRQHCGTTGNRENCQVGVFLSYVSPLGHTLIDRELYLPMSWIEDRERCQEAGIADTVGFATKCELAKRMVERLWQANIPFSWVVADCVYGNNEALRTWLEAHDYFYVLAVTCTQAVGIQTTSGMRRMTVEQAEALSFGADDWQRLSMSCGTKGERLFDWAVMPLLHKWEDDGQHFRLLRRPLDDPEKKTYYLVFAPVGTTLAELVKAIGQRWHIEEDIQIGKEMGLADYEVRGFTAWYRYITLVMLVAACLASITAQERRRGAQTCTQETPEPPCSLLPLTIPEVRHLLAHLLWPVPRRAQHLLDWSDWRRCHQSRASYLHTKRRCARHKKIA